MNASTDVPVIITPEAEARLAELGMRKEMEQMVAYLREFVPELTAIGVEIAECYDSREETGISVVAYSDRLFDPGESVSDKIDYWAVRAFPPQVLEHLGIMFSQGRPDAR
ncbi:MAG TPA: hypothetical protein VMF69_23290 [Gemmataceae bacterium]|nr:hypothetical protein [Gemmataceae bacterium]